MHVHSIRGQLYYIIFIDELSRNKWIHYLMHKDEDFNMFKDFNALIENQTGKKIFFSRYDNGGEYISNRLIDFCKKEIILPYNPKHNGVTKRKNRSIVEVSRAMLHDKKLLKFLWGVTQ